MQERQMIQALLVTSSPGSFSQLDSTFSKNDVETIWAESGNSALSMILEGSSFDIIILNESLRDMGGIELAKKLISKNPMLNLALVSALSSKDFHEASEGLGILMQLPPNPQKADAEKLLEHLNHILLLTKKEN
jgi:DNA-binding response OmpR family regulator